MTMTPLKIGLVGLGNMGQNHLRVLSMLKDVELRFIYDIDQDRTFWLAEANNIPIAQKLEKDCNEIDALVIATPTKTHFEYVEKAKDRVNLLFVEKPLAATRDQCETIATWTREKGIKIQVGFIERFNPAVIALQRVLWQAKKVINIDFTRTNKLSSRITDIDVIMDLMIHDIDLALFFNGPVAEINSYGIVEDGLVAFARTVLRHDNGVFSSLTASRITEKKIRQITVTCEDMFVDCNLLRKEIVINKQSRVDQYIEDIFLASKEETVGLNPQEALLLQDLAFVKYCSGTPDPNTPTAEDGLNAMIIAEKIQQQILG